MRPKQTGPRPPGYNRGWRETLSQAISTLVMVALVAGVAYLIGFMPWSDNPPNDYARAAFIGIFALCAVFGIGYTLERWLMRLLRA